MPPIILVGLIISAIYLLFNDNEESPRKAESGEKKDETVLAHDARSRRGVRRPRLERKHKPDGAKSNRTRVATTYTDMNDELVNDEPKEEHASE